jgi:hypothetical protein
MLTPQSYKFSQGNFYISKFWLISDQYISLVSQFKA